MAPLYCAAKFDPFLSLEGRDQILPSGNLADEWPIGRFISRNRKLDRAFVAPKHFTALPLATDRSRWCWWWIGLPEGQSRSLTEIAALRISSIDVTQRT